MEAFGDVVVPGAMEEDALNEGAGMLNGRTVPHNEECSAAVPRVPRREPLGGPPVNVLALASLGSWVPVLLTARCGWSLTA